MLWKFFFEWRYCDRGTAYWQTGASFGAHQSNIYDRLQPQELVLFNYTRIQQTSNADPDPGVGGPGHFLAVVLLFDGHSLGVA